LYEKYFNSSELQEIIQRTFENGLHEVALKPSRFKLAEFLDKNYKNVREHLAIRDDNGDTIFGKHRDRFKLQAFIMILRKTFDDEKMFHEFFKALNEKSETLKSIAKMKSELTNNHQFGMFPLLRATAENVRSKSERNFFKEFLLSKSEDNGTLMHALFFQNSNEIHIEPFLEILRKFLGREEIIYLLFAQNLPQATPMMISAWFSTEKSLKRFWNFTETFLNFEERKKLLNTTDKFFGVPLHHAMANDDPKSMLFIKQHYENIFVAEEIRGMLMKQHPILPYFDRIFREASLATVEEDKKFYLEVFKDDKGKLRELLSFRRGSGETIFGHYQRKEGADRKLKIFIDLLRKTFEKGQEKEFDEYLMMLSAKL
jgi:hypothetical protein